MSESKFVPLAVIVKCAHLRASKDDGRRPSRLARNARSPLRTTDEERSAA
jgi:hypothetical protein